MVTKKSAKKEKYTGIYIALTGIDYEKGDIQYHFNAGESIDASSVPDDFDIKGLLDVQAIEPRSGGE
jgi:hypothetical protein